MVDNGTGPVFYPADGSQLSGNYGYGNTTFQRLPDPGSRFDYEESPAGNFLINLFRHGFFRAEYLHYDYKRPGDKVLGAPVGSPQVIIPDPVTGGPVYPNGPLGGTNPINPLPGDPYYFDPRTPFKVNDPYATDPQGNLTGIATGIVPTLDAFRQRNNNGFRGTFGLDLPVGSLEVSSFILQDARQSAVNTDFTTRWANTDLPALNTGVPNYPNLVVAQGVLVNNALSATGYLIDDLGYQSLLKTSVWGSEAKFVLPTRNNGDFVQFRPLVGFRYFNYSEVFNQSGQYTAGNAPNTSTQTRIINADTKNNFYGPEIGMRMEVGTSRLVIGAEPRVMLGVNTYKANLFTNNLVSTVDAATGNLIHDPSHGFSEKKTTFGPMAELGIYSRAYVTESWGFFVSYNLLWAGQLTHPYDNIYYNMANASTSAFAQNVKFNDAVIQGVTVGSEVRW